MDTGVRSPRGPTKAEIEKCDNEQQSCKDTCDRTQIDVENQIEQCKKNCDTDRVLCLQFRVGTTPKGNVTGGANTVGADSHSTSQQVCCRVKRGSTTIYAWLSRGDCKPSPDRVVMQTPAKCPSMKSQ